MKGSIISFAAVLVVGLLLLGNAVCDEAIEFKTGGRIMNDWAWFDADPTLEAAVGPFDDGTEFRRARLYVAGTIHDNVGFKAQYDFAGGDADFKDVWASYKDFPLAPVKIGHFKEPFSLEELTSSKYITFMERALPVEAFAPSRNTGIGFGSSELDDQLTWSVGVFRDTDDFGGGEDSDYNFTARVTGVPWAEEDQERMLHIGGSISYKNTDMVQYRSRPEAHLAPRVVDTKEFAADNVVLCGLESALLLGPVSLQGEYMLAQVDADIGSDPDFSGYYGAVSWFLTGETRAYKASKGVFSRVSPAANAGADGGSGAWELAARYSSLDLSDGAIAAGEVDDVTLAVNWYVNPHARVMFNYVNSDTDGVGEVDVFETRFQVDF